MSDCHHEELANGLWVRRRILAWEKQIEAERNQSMGQSREALTASMLADRESPRDLGEGEGG